MKIRWTGIRKYVLITGLVLLAVGFALQPYDMLVQNLHARYQPVFFKSRDGITDISGFLYFPQSYEPSAQYPTVVLVHGINANTGLMIRIAVELIR
ncbi:MAG: hypothetical protein ACTSRW_15865, partial [Candidatus Helarchaeota archaeon]